VAPNSKALIPAALIIGILTLTAVLTAATAFGVPVGIITRDLITLCTEAGPKLPPFAGALSLFNLMVWASTASLAFLAAALLPGRRKWLLTFAALVCLLDADDALSLHEAATSTGIPELGFYVIYAVLAAALSLTVIWRSTRDLRIEASTVAFFLGGLLLAASILIDQAFVGQHLAEDGPKLMGALVWLTVPLLCLPADSANRLASPQI
jgi:hypothetical protein